MCVKNGHKKSNTILLGLNPTYRLEFINKNRSTFSFLKNEKYFVQDYENYDRNDIVAITLKYLQKENNTIEE